MARRTVLSGRLVKSRAALLGKSLQDVNNEAKFGTNYIYRLWDRETVTLETINKIADVLNCEACDLVEVIEVEAEMAAPEGAQG